MNACWGYSHCNRETNGLFLRYNRTVVHAVIFRISLFNKEAKMKLEKAPNCPHCGKELDKYDTPSFHFADGLGWGTDFLYVCFNDECSLYVKGKKYLWEKYGQAASYRYMVYPDTGQEDTKIHCTWKQGLQRLNHGLRKKIRKNKLKF